MNAVLACAGARLWRQRVTWLSLAVLVALGGGAVLAAVAGGRRTDSAYRRFAAAHRAADVFVFPAGGPTPTSLPSDYATMAKFPEVVASAVLQGFNTEGPSVIGVSGGYGRTINEPKVLSGRLPRPDHAEETAVSLDFAQSHHVSVGSRLTVRFLAGAPGSRPARSCRSPSGWSGSRSARVTFRPS